MSDKSVNSQSNWSQAAKEGLMLAAVTVVVSTLSMLVNQSFLSSLLWALKLGGSIWILWIVMKRWGLSHVGQSSFGYGFKVCLCSALVIAVFTFFLYRYVFPDKVSEIFDQLYENLDTMTAAYGALPDNFQDMMLKFEDNYAQYSCISTFIWDVILGLIFSGILTGSTTSRNGNGIFTEEEMNQTEEQ